jgi:hypothetical protein
MSLKLRVTFKAIVTDALSGKEWQHLLPVVHHNIVVLGLGTVNLSLNLVAREQMEAH